MHSFNQDLMELIQKRFGPFSIWTGKMGDVGTHWFCPKGHPTTKYAFMRYDHDTKLYQLAYNQLYTEEQLIRVLKLYAFA